MFLRDRGLGALDANAPVIEPKMTGGAEIVAGLKPHLSISFSGSLKRTSPPVEPHEGQAP